MPEPQHDPHDALTRAVTGTPRLPGAVALAATRNGRCFAAAVGERVAGEGVAMTTDTVVMASSLTKPLVGTVCLQLMEAGLLDLDAPAKRYAPEIGRLEVLEGFDDRDQPILRPPRRDVTTRMLLLHTAGFGYDFMHPYYRRLVKEHGLPSIATGKRAALMMPLLFDPGDDWLYGASMDWAGQVVEGVTGQRLDEALQSRLLAPLQMSSTAFVISEAMRARLARVHHRRDDTLVPMHDYEHPQTPDVFMAGHAMYTTGEDYLRFIELWLHDGQVPGGPRLLQPNTIAHAAQNGLGDRRIKKLTSVNRRVSHDFEMFEGVPKSWGLTFMINEADAPTGRRAGSLGWSGLANQFFWIDRTSGVGGFWATQLLPFGDPTAVEAYLAFEHAIYAHHA